MSPVKTEPVGQKGILAVANLLLHRRPVILCHYVNVVREVKDAIDMSIVPR